MLSKDLELNLNAAFKGARARRHEFMTVEHLLLALLDNDAAGKVLRACGADMIQLRGELAEFVETTTPVIPQEDAERETEPTLGFQRVLQRAVFHVQSSGRNEVTGANVLVAMFSEQESQAVYLLKKQNIARIDVVNYITHGISKVSDAPRPGGAEPGEEEQQGQDGEASPLQSFATNLNEEARAGRIDPLVGRAGSRARGADPRAPAQEQSVAGRRIRGGQNRDRRGARQAHRRWRGARRAGAQRGSTRWTWVRCSRAPSTAAISRSVSRGCSPS